MTAKAEILSALREHRAELRSLGALRLGIFGSIARKDQRPDSDLDVLVELDQHTFDRYMDLKLYLEDLVGRRVDLVPADSIKPRMRAHILSELIDAA
jgi:predicted nucleotidyltransferase